MPAANHNRILLSTASNYFRQVKSAIDNMHTHGENIRELCLFQLLDENEQE